MADTAYRGQSGGLPAIPLESLNFSAKAIEALRDRGFNSVNDLISRARISGLKDIQKEDSAEINEAFRALLRSASDVNWQHYRQLSYGAGGFALLPARERVVWTGSHFAQEFSRVIKEVGQIQFGPLHAFVLEHRTLRRPERRWTLERIGRKLSVSRQRIAAMEKRTITVLRRSLLNRDYRRLHFRFRPAFVEPLRALQAALKVQQVNGIVSQKSLAQTIQLTWRIDRKEIADLEQLVLDILDLRVGT